MVYFFQAGGGVLFFCKENARFCLFWLFSANFGSFLRMYTLLMYFLQAQIVWWCTKNWQIPGLVLFIRLQEVVERNAFAYNTHCRHCWTGLGKTQLSSRLCCQLCSMALSIVVPIVVPFLLSLVNYFLRSILCYWCSKLLVLRHIERHLFLMLKYFQPEFYTATEKFDGT